VAKKKRPGKGDGLVVKNGPREATWDAEFRVKDVADTIWWYYKSGQDISTVFGEQELQRFICRLN